MSIIRFLVVAAHSSNRGRLFFSRLFTAAAVALSGVLTTQRVVSG